MIGGNETRLLCPNYNDDKRKKKMQTDNVKKRGNTKVKSCREVGDNNQREKERLFAYHPESVSAVNRRWKRLDSAIHTYLWPRYSDVDKKHMTQTRGATAIMVSNHKKRGIIKGDLHRLGSGSM